MSLRGFMQPAYGDNVSFYGKTISKTALLQENKTAERWPIRSYSVRPDSLDIHCQTTICHVEGLWIGGVEPGTREN